MTSWRMGWFRHFQKQMYWDRYSCTLDPAFPLEWHSKLSHRNTQRFSFVGTLAHAFLQNQSGIKQGLFAIMNMLGSIRSPFSTFNLLKSSSSSSSLPSSSRHVFSSFPTFSQIRYRSQLAPRRTKYRKAMKGMPISVSLLNHSILDVKLRSLTSSLQLPTVSFPLPHPDCHCITCSR